MLEYIHFQRFAEQSSAWLNYGKLAHRNKKNKLNVVLLQYFMNGHIEMRKHARLEIATL